MPKKRLSREDYLKLVGLFTLAVRASKQMEQVSEAAASIINDKGNDAYDKGGWMITDNCYDNDFSGFDKALREHFIIKK